MQKKTLSDLTNSHNRYFYLLLTPREYVPNYIAKKKKIQVGDGKEEDNVAPRYKKNY